MDVPGYSARFAWPFAHVLSTRERSSDDRLKRPPSVDRTGRISVAAAHSALADQVERTADPDLGLKAGRLLPLGAAGGLSYAMYTAATVRDVLDMAGRFARLFSDLLDVRYEIHGKQTL